jgi:hypothetical protein
MFSRVAHAADLPALPPMSAPVLKRTDMTVIHVPSPPRHIATRRSGAVLTIAAAIVGGAVMMASIAWHHDLAQAAPVATLGTLRWQVSKMAFDATKVLIIFFIKNLVMVLVHPARYGQVRAPLVEQRVPDVEAPVSGIPDVALVDTT